MGNRVCKIEKPYNLTSTGWKYTFYVRDASGNIMTTYTKTGSEIENNVLKLDEVMLYGSSHIGTREVNALLSGLTVSTTTFSRSLGLKRYEIYDNLNKNKDLKVTIKVNSDAPTEDSRADYKRTRGIAIAKKIDLRLVLSGRIKIIPGTEKTKQVKFEYTR